MGSIRKRDVEAAFQNLCLTAKKAGIRGVDRWVLYLGSPTNGVAYYIRAMGPDLGPYEVFTMNLTTNTRTAYGKITSMNSLLWLIVTQNGVKKQRSRPRDSGPVASTGEEKEDASTA